MTVLFISPLMFALTHNMSGVIQTVRDSLAESAGGGDLDNSPINLNLDAERSFEGFFDLFVYLMVLTNSIVSVLLMSVVKYGNVRQNIKRIPVYYIVSITIYALCKMFFSSFLVI
jgi:hypothetical protein